MTVHGFARLSVTLVVVTLFSGCSWFGQDSSSGSGVTGRDDTCSRNPTSCIHEGRYDLDEQEYAEREAKRLNEAEVIRLRRRSVW